MSMSVDYFSCDRCDFNASITSCWGKFSYQDQSELLPVNRAAGWCYSCSSIVPVEILPEQVTVATLKADVSEKERQLSEAKARSIAKQTFLQKIFRIRQGVPEYIRDLESNYSGAVDCLDEEKQRLRFLERRRSPPRCLKCGSIECHPLPPQTDGMEANGCIKHVFPIGFQHPGCGGNLLAKTSDFRVSMILSHRIYDIEGIFLREEEKIL